MQELCSIRSVRSVGTFLGLFVCANVRRGAGTAYLCLPRRCQSCTPWCHASAGRTSSLEYPRTSRKGCPLVRRPTGRFGFSRQLRRQIPGDASVRDGDRRNCDSGSRSRKLAVSNSFGEEKRFVVFRYGGGQRRDRIPPHREK